ncbi:MAG TPA: tetratricopeptide repeat protein [Polyangia bacterium]|nr:tetratricopeptide repeat protein [Polyangia bacterium]
MTTWASAFSLRVLVAFFVVLSLSVKAMADDNDDAVAKITQMNKDAVTAYQAKKFDDAKKILKQALDLADSAGLQQHPITARTHIHMGIVIIGGFNQRELGIKQFKKALEIESTINLTKSLVTPELSDAFAEAKSGGNGAASAPPAAATESAPEAPPEAAPEPAPAPPAAEAQPAAESGGLVHEPITTARRGSAISITVGVPGDLKFDKMVLAYRPDGASEFLGRQMKEVAEGRYGAEIPPTATGGGSVAYYVEADDSDGNAVATKGTIDKPLVISLGGGSAPVAHKSEDSNDDDDGTPDHQYFVSLMLGTGFGWATGPGDTNHDVSISPAGMALAGLGQIAPEFGYWWSSSLLLSIQLRYQYITGTTDVFNGGKDYHTAHYAFAAFAKATWKLGDGEGKLHPFFSLAAGGGQIRHVVTFGTKLIPEPTGCGTGGMQNCVDTIAAGPFLVGPGGGVLYDLTDSLSLIGQLNTQLGLPNFTFNVDVNVGVAMQF